MLIAPLVYMILQLKFFRGVASGREIQEKALDTAGKKANFWLVFAITAALPAILFIPVTYRWVGQQTFVPAIYNKVFAEANINELAAWSAVAGIVIVAVLLINYAVYGKNHQVSLDNWGIKTNAKQFFKSLLMAFIVVGCAFVVVAAVEYIFGTDFRIWVLSVKMFDLAKVRFILVYFPGYVIFYLGNSIAVNGNNDIKGWKEWQKMLVSCIGNIGGLIVLLIIQYSSLIGRGQIVFNAMRILNIFPLLVLVPVATVISRKIYKMTQNVYLGSMIFGILYAAIACTNTMFMF